jgi:hypothetical protein
MVLRLLTLVSLLFLSQASLARQQKPDDVPDTCPVTRSTVPPFVPPWPYPLKAGPGWFWFGTKRLWTMLPAGGVWSGLPHTESGYTQKMGWFNEAFNWRLESYPAITVIGRRLDRAALHLKVTGINGGHTETLESVMGVRVNIPSLGCWEIKGQYRDAHLTFVVWVAN